MNNQRPAQNDHLQPASLLYTTALDALRRGERPANVIKSLLAQGTHPQHVAQIMRLSYETLQQDTAAPRHVTAAAVHDAIAAAVRADQPDETICRQLIDQSIPDDVVARLVAQVWQVQHRREGSAGGASPRALHLMNSLVGGLVLLALLLGWHRLRNEPDLFTSAFSNQQTVGIGLATGARAPDAAPVPDPVANAVVMVQQLNVRSGPGSEYPLLLQLPASTPLHVIGRAPDAPRYKIIVGDAREGWVRSDPEVVQLLIAPDSIPLVPVHR